MTLHPISYLFTVVLIFKMTIGYTQSKQLNKKITLEVRDVTLENLFEKLRQNYQVKLVYGAQNFPETQRITIKANNISIRHFLNRLCANTGLSYRVVDEYVIFEYKIPLPKVAYRESKATKVVVVSEKLLPKQESTQADSLLLNSSEPRIDKEQIIAIQELNGVDSISSLANNKPIIVGENSTIKKRTAISSYRISLYASCDYHLFNFKPLPDNNQEYQPELSSSFGSSFSISAGKNTLIGIGILCSSKKFTYQRNFKMLNLDDVVSIPDITRLSYTYIEVPFEIDYRVINQKKAKVNLTPGIDMAFLFDKEETTTYLTQGNPSTEYFINATNSFLWGPQVAIRVECPIMQSFSFFISPRYVHYIKPVNEAAMRSGNDLFRLQAGIQLNIYNRKTI